MTIPPTGVLASFDRVLPGGVFTSPAAGNVVGTITLKVTPTDNDRVANVQFQIDGVNIGGPVTSPYQASYDTRAVQNGPHTISAVITDRVGNQTTISQAVTMQNAPTVAVTNPVNGNYTSGIITLSASVTAYDPVVTVQFQVDGANVGGPVGAPFQVGYDTHLLPYGWHTFTAIATDGHGNSATSSVSSYANNQPPASTVTSLGELLVWSDGGGDYEGGRSGPEPNDGSGGNWIWGNTGQKIGYLNLPGNPDPTHYQMRAFFYAERVEGGSDGNIVFMDILIAGNWYEPWANGPSPCGPPGPNQTQIYITNVNGGEQIGAKRWCTRPGWNGCICFNIGVWCDFVPKGPYQS